MIFSLSRWFSSSEKEKKTTDVHVEPDTRSVQVEQRQRKRKHQKIQSEDLESDTSDTSNYVNDDVEEDDDKVIDIIEDGIDNEEFIDPDIDKAGGWVYGKEGAFPDIDAILTMWWEGKWKKGRRKVILTCQEIMGKGNKEKARELDQEQLDFLVHRWLLKLEHHKDHKELSDLRGDELWKLKVTINESHEMMTEKLTSQKEDDTFDNDNRRPIGTYPQTLAHKKDRAVCNKMRPVLNHTSCLQKMTTFHDFVRETDSVGKTQHILCCLDQLIPIILDAKRKNLLVVTPSTGICWYFAYQTIVIN